MAKDNELKPSKPHQEVWSGFATTGKPPVPYESLLSRVLKSKDIQEAIWNIRSNVWKTGLGHYISQLVLAGGFENKEVIERSGFDKTYYYQVLNGKKKPSRDKVIQLCFGLQLDIEGSNTLLQKSGHNALYARSERDAIIIFCLHNSYTLYDTDVALSEAQHFTLLPEK